MNLNEVIKLIDKNQNTTIQLNSNQINDINSIEIFYLLFALEMKLIEPNQVLSLGIKLKNALLVGFSFRFQYNRANPNSLFNGVHVLIHAIRLFMKSSNANEEEELLNIIYLLIFKNSSINSIAKNDSKFTVKEILIQQRMTSLLERIESFKNNIDEYILLKKLSIKKEKRFHFIDKSSLNLLGYSLDDDDLIDSFNLKKTIQYHTSINDEHKIDSNRLILYSCLYSSPESMKYFNQSEEEFISPVVVQKLILTVDSTEKYRKLNDCFRYHLMKIMTYSSLHRSFSITEEQLKLLNINFESSKLSLKINSDHLIQDSSEKLSKLIGYLQLENNEKIIFNSEEIKNKFRKILEINSIVLNEQIIKLIITDEEQFQVFKQFSDEVKSLTIAMFTLNRLKLDYTFIERLKKKLKQ